VNRARYRMHKHMHEKCNLTINIVLGSVADPDPVGYEIFVVAKIYIEQDPDPVFFHSSDPLVSEFVSLSGSGIFRGRILIRIKIVWIRNTGTDFWVSYRY
jgi:hypothetical protein